MVAEDLLTKVCTECGVEKPLEDFYTHKERNGNITHRSRCKECELRLMHLKRIGPDGDRIRARDRANRAANRDKINAKNRERYYENYDRYVSYKTKWREANPDAGRNYAKEYRLKNADKVKTYKREYYRAHPEIKRKYDKKYRDTHHDHRNEYQRVRKQNDPLFAMKHRIGTLIRTTIKKGGYRKNSRSTEILGADYETVFNHLKATWLKNYGTEWNGEDYQIDHVIPLATAKSKEDVIKLSHYTNLQMLTPKDNLDKRAKLDWTINNMVQ